MPTRTPCGTAPAVILAGSLLLPGCGPDTASGPAATATTATVQPVAVRQPGGDTQVALGNTRYLFVVDDHSEVELEALLHRVDDVARTSLDRFDHLKIALVIHGPSVKRFTRAGYSGNRDLVDLAAKLEAFDVIDVKICETSMASEGISRSDVPSFIDPVPFAPDEIARLGSAGFINL